MLLALMTPATAQADDSAGSDQTATTLVRRLAGEDAHAGPLLHLDVIAPNAVEAEGGILDGRTAVIALGPRVRLAAEGQWWQTGLAPSMFAEDLRVHGWRAGAELAYDVGPFRVAISASMERDGDSSHRVVGLFAYRTFRLSRWMHAWIVLGAGLEQWSGVSPYRGTGGAIAVSIGMSFR